jgi:hypothetical protein
VVGCWVSAVSAVSTGAAGSTLRSLVVEEVSAVMALAVPSAVFVDLVRPSASPTAASRVVKGDPLQRLGCQAP